MFKKGFFLILVLILAGIFSGCNPEFSENQGNASLSFEAFVAEQGIVKIEKGYLFEGDILLSEKAVIDMYDNYSSKGNLAVDDFNDRYVWTTEEKNNLTYGFFGDMATLTLTNAQVRNAFREALADWMSVADFTAVEVATNPDILVGLTFDPPNAQGENYVAFGTFPHMLDASGQGSILGINLYCVDVEYNTYDRMVGLLKHEFGHIIGLAHEHQRTEAPDHYGQGVYGEAFGAYDPDSVMEYTNGFDNFFLDGLSYGDVITIQSLYGPAYWSWDFNDDLADNGNNHHTGVNHSCVYSTDSVAGKSFLLNGSNYGDVNQTASLNMGLLNFTISAWVKTTSTKTYNTIVDKRNSSDLTGYLLELFEGKPLLQLHDSTDDWFNYYQINGGTTVNDGKWHNILFSVNRTVSTNGIRLYIDGKYTAAFNSSYVTGNIDSSAVLRIGKHAQTSSHNFEGRIDNLFIQKRANTNGSITGLPQIRSISNGPVSLGSWNADSLESNVLAGSYSSYYRFTLSATKTVTITLDSADQDAYLAVLKGTTIDTAAYFTNDNGGTGTNARVYYSLPAGTYIIDATTRYSKKEGSFSIKLSYAC